MMTGTLRGENGGVEGNGGEGIKLFRIEDAT